MMEKPLSLPTKALLLGAGGLAVITGPVLYLWPDQTATYFAWTIKHPLTPVFMGASYLAGIGNFWALRLNRWSVARVQMPAIIAFATAMLIATLLHIPSFNWAHPIAWAWLAVYIVSPPAALVLFILNERAQATPNPAWPPLPGSFTPVMIVFAVIDLLVGLALFLFPGQVAPMWPWSLTPLTARVVGGWLLGSVGLLGMLAQQRTLDTARIGLFANVLIAALLLLGALIHAADFDGPSLAVGLYLLRAVLLGGFSAFSWLWASRLAAPGQLQGLG